MSPIIDIMAKMSDKFVGDLVSSKLDIDLMNIINEAAEKAAEQTGKLIKAEIRLEMSDMKSDIHREMTNQKEEITEAIRKVVEEELGPHLGELSAHEHLTHHERMKSIIHIVETITQKFWLRIIQSTIFISILGIGMYVFVSIVGPTVIKDHIKPEPPKAEKQINEPKTEG